MDPPKCTFLTNTFYAFVLGLECSFPLLLLTFIDFESELELVDMQPSRPRVEIKNTSQRDGPTNHNWCLDTMELTPVVYSYTI